MMKEKNIKLERIVELSSAVDLINSNSNLDGKVAYWIGRLGDNCLSPIKQFNKQREKIAKEIQVEQEPFLKTLNKLDREKEKDKVFENNQEIQKLEEKFRTKLQELLDQEEKILIPDFELKDFLAKEDITRIDKVREGKEEKSVEVKIKKDQSLVPVKFFRLMGEYIKE